MERKSEILNLIQEKFNYTQLVDFTSYEASHLFLEGTGSMVFDRDNKIAYACLSPRTDEIVLEDFCQRMNYRSVVFYATNKSGTAIYHTNVMMCIADHFVVICLDSIPNQQEKMMVRDSILDSGKEIFEITLIKWIILLGNMLQLENKSKKKKFSGLCRVAAWQSFFFPDKKNSYPKTT